MSMDKSLEAELYRTVADYVDEYRDLVKQGIPGIAEEIEDPLTGENVDFPEPYQIEEAKFLRDNERVLIADDMGTGKTVTPVLGHYLVDDIDHSLIIAPGYLRDHWAESIQEFTEDDPVVNVLDSYDPEDLRDLDEADFIVMNYSIFGRGREDIVDAVSGVDFDMIALDEVHNVRNTDAKSSQNVVQLAEVPEYLCMLSGTPVPNDLNDIYGMIHMLEHENYENPNEVKRKHMNQPRTVRAVLNRRRISWDLEEIVDMPELVDHQEDTDGSIELKGLHQEVYDAVRENDLLEGTTKMKELLKATLDPSLVNPDVIYDSELSENLGSVPSTKYDELRELMEEIDEAGEKAVVYTPHFTEGVTDKIAEEFEEFDPVRIDGNVLQSDRTELVDYFEDSDSSMMIATTKTAGEGLDVTEASNVIFLHEPWTPAEREQAIKRVWRRGQEDQVDVYSLAAHGTVDEGILELLEQKEQAIRFVEEGLKLSDEQLELLLNDSKKPVRDKMYTPQQKALWYYSRLSGHDVETVWENLSKNDFEIAEDVAENHAKEWEDSYSANAARAYSQIVEAATSEDDRIVDLGSGHGALSEMVDRQIANIDLNKFNFLGERADPEDDNIVGTINQLPLKEESAEAALSSLSLHYTSTDGTPSEREEAVMEANRILEEGGKYIITLPLNLMTQVNANDLQEGLHHYGFEIDENLSGIVRSESSEIDFNTFVATALKTDEPGEPEGDYFRFEENSDEEAKPGMRNSGEVENFVVKTLEGEMGLEEAIETSTKV